jgi:hypothetical protein
LGHLAFAAGVYICYGQFAAPVQKWPKIAPKSPKLAKKSSTIANWPAISAASAVEIVLPQLCSSQAEFAAEVSPP